MNTETQKSPIDLDQIREQIKAKYGYRHNAEIYTEKQLQDILSKDPDTLINSRWEEFGVHLVQWTEASNIMWSDIIIIVELK